MGLTVKELREQRIRDAEQALALLEKAKAERAEAKAERIRALKAEALGAFRCGKTWVSIPVTLEDRAAFVVSLRKEDVLSVSRVLPGARKLGSSEGVPFAGGLRLTKGVVDEQELPIMDHSVMRLLVECLD